MKRFIIALAFVVLAWSCEKKPLINPNGNTDPVDPTPVTPASDKFANITYQLNVYSFADSDGNGWGDIRGITDHLDYFTSLGVSSLWLSPLQKAASYHGYDILDYYTIDPRLGTETDFQELIDKAHQKGISIYMDYVLNHSGRGAWFESAISSEDSPYRSYYVISKDGAADAAAGKVDNFGGAKNPSMGTWHTVATGNLGYKGRLKVKVDMNAKTVTVTETTESAQNPNTNSPKCWLWYGSISSHVGMYTTGSNTYELVLNMDTDWGFLVCTSTNWASGTRWGGNGKPITFGQPYKLNNADGAPDITFGGDAIQYFASFDQSMPDLNYGPYDKASESACFKDLAASADKWINMGVDGLRLDAVMWIYQCQSVANASFLKQWYDHCNATYKARGGAGEFYMVGEAFEEAGKVAYYYRGLPSLFNFSYWWTLKDRINSGRGDNFASTVISFRNLFRTHRPDAIDAIKLSNHDEDRAGSDLGKSVAKMKLAGAVLLTSAGKPFIYQGEELGYWGTKSNGDEYIRTPILWTREGTYPTSALYGKVDKSMLKPEISVEAQDATDDSILKVYKAFAAARNKYKALGAGAPQEVTSTVSSVAVWKMSADGEAVLVVHNFSGKEATVKVDGYKTTEVAVSNGTVSASGTSVTLGPYASVVYVQ